MGPRGSGLTVVVVASVLLSACAADGADGPSASAVASGLPTVGFATDGPAGDWQVLFDGNSTSAFRGYGQSRFPSEAWQIDGDALRAVPGAGTDLVSIDKYVDFELEFEWRVGPGGNSGVMYRVAETSDPAWTTGPEYQVLDDALHPDGADPLTSAAALYGLVAPGPEKRLEPVGAYNAGRIVVRANRVEHWLNGALVVAYDWDGPAVRDLIADSKFAGLAGFMAHPSGPVVLQHHGQEAWFRAIRIRRLDTPG